MQTRNVSRTDGFIMFLLFIGFGGIVGWLATAMFGLYGFPSLGFLVIAVLGLPWGVMLRRRSEHQGKLAVEKVSGTFSRPQARSHAANHA